MASPTLLDTGSRSMAEKKRWVPRKDFHPPGDKEKKVLAGKPDAERPKNLPRETGKSLYKNKD